MTPEQMQARSKEKVQQVLNLMKTLHLKVEAKQKISPEGFLENQIFWIDDEKYVPAPVVAAPAESAPTGTHDSSGATGPNA